jgi:hypothetical protein
MTIRCTHLNQVLDVAPRTPAGCEECLRNPWPQRQGSLPLDSVAIASTEG